MILLILIIVVHWYASLFHHSFFLHRYITHGQFKLSKFWERFFWVTTWLTQGSSYLNPKAYAKMHLEHHLYSDKLGDPHSPGHYSGIIFMILKTKKTFMEIIEGTHEISFLYKNKKFPEWKHFEKIADSSLSMYGFIVLYAIAYYFLIPAWAWPFILINIFNGPIQGAIVNWYGHKKGYRNFNTDDNSRNTFRKDIPLLGELFQNNHHADPDNPNFARKKNEFDPLYYLGIKPLAWLGIIKLNPATM